MEEDDGRWVDEAEVMSEVHLGCKPSLRSDVSVFEISLPNSFDTEIRQVQDGDEDCRGTEEGLGDHDVNRAGTDAHGDLIIPRRRRRKIPKVTRNCVCLHHHLSTRLLDVGLQIWKGALLLSDYILHEMQTTKRFADMVALELGAGTGLVGLVMARYARLVFITDRGMDILDNCSRNVVTNSSSLKHAEATVRVRELDWHQPWPPQNDQLSGNNIAYSWSLEDIEECDAASVLLAADVVYSPELTDAFFHLLKNFMPFGSGKVLYLALEKRYNFSIRDQDVVAHDYKHFRSFFTDDSTEKSGENEDVDSYGEAKQFRGRRINIDEVGQYIMNYDRGKDLELWELRSTTS